MALIVVPQQNTGQIKWTTLASSGTLTSSSGWTNSNLSGYKRYRLVWKNFKPATNYYYICLQINGDAGQNYIVNNYGKPSGSSNYNNSNPAAGGTAAYFWTNTMGLQSGAYSANGYMEIQNADASDGHKMLIGEGNTNDAYGSGDTRIVAFGTWLSNNPVTSLKFYTDGNTFTSDGVYLYGGN